ncbi:hypothetical protein ACFC00_40320 [Streptomyces adustus]|uniref:TetR/AcrR family transcriptional regulator n=1 Tax=Streptomyces adustus TaxID=1609272 RepID=UPI0035DC58FA
MGFLYVTGAERHLPPVDSVRAGRPRSVLSDEGAAGALRQFLATHLLGPLVAASRRDQPDLRVSLAASHLAGLAIGRHVLGVAPLAMADIEQLVACAAPVTQHHLTGRLPVAPTARTN